MLDASTLVEVNCVQLAALAPDVLTSLLKSITLFLLTLPAVVAAIAVVTEYSFALMRLIAKNPLAAVPEVKSRYITSLFDNP
mgnify:CR=1 FL=1